MQRRAVVSRNGLGTRNLPRMAPRNGILRCLRWFPWLVCLAVGLSSFTAFGQSLGLAPAQVVQTFKPGVPFEFELSTVNNGENPVEMNVEITDFWYNDKNEKVFSAPGTSPRSAANWIQFVPEHFNVAAHSAQQMKAI